MNSINETFDLLEDEIILMIRKGNEEALGLLFSMYETKIRFESTFFGSKFNLPTFDKEDLYQEIKISFYEAIRNYDYKSGRFYNFFIIIMKRNLYNQLRKECSPSNDSRRNEEYNEGRNYDEFEFDDYIKYDFELSIRNVEKERDSTFADCLKMWMEGYTYQEISQLLNLSLPSVNYRIRMGLNLIKNKLE